MTNEELEAIKKRAEAATDGPWEYDEASYCIDAPGFEVCTEVLPPDAEFIAHAREDIPKLLAEIERLHSVNKALTAVIKGDVKVTRDVRMAVVRELLGDKIEESAKRLADELRRKLGDPK